MDSLPLRENFIAKVILGEDYEEVKVASKSVQKQTRSGQKTRHKAVVVIGNGAGVLGIGVSTAKDHPAAVAQAAAQARTNIIPVRLGYFGEAKNEKSVHTLPFNVTGKSGSVRVRLIPAPMGRGIVANKTCGDILKLAGITNCFVVSKGHTSSRENHAKATFDALKKTYSFYPPQDWDNQNYHRSLADEAVILNLKQMTIG
ncbi:MAG: 40S ribosomal protein [Marteilia pararefringens]